jgi:signal transduction histidine kinase
MTRSLAWKLTLAFLLVAATTAGLVAAFLRFSSTGQLNRLIVEQQRSELEAALVAYYRANDGWDGVRDYLWRARSEGFSPAAPRPTDFAGDDHHPEYRRDRRDFFGLADARGRVVAPLLPDYPVGAEVAEAALRAGTAVTVDGQVVGTILTAARSPGLNPEEAAYLERANAALTYAALGAVLVALAVGGLLARTLTRPLRALTQATQRMAGGELEQEVTVKATDEIGELVTAFNQMSQAVSRAQAARRQMTADVAHELRTPLTVIAGYVEAMRDGDLDPTPQRLATIYTEIERLQHLVGDLRTLAQADAGELRLNRQALDPADLLRQAAAAFEHQAAQAGVALAVEAGAPLPAVAGDEARLGQVLANLVSNALRYTPAGGRVTLSASDSPGTVRLTVRDTGRGIAPEDLPYIFHRLYRGDKARATAAGESGLGLAIAKALVEAHAGSIAAQSARGAGTTILIELPAATK